MRKRKNSSKSLIVIGFVMGLAFCLVLLFLFTPSAVADNFLPKGSSESMEIVEDDVWENNLRLMQEVANELDIRVSDTNSIEAYKKALKNVDRAQLDNIKELNLSGGNQYKVPDIIREFRNLEKLDISYNQITFIPEFIKTNQNLTVDYRYNLLSNEYEEQSSIYISDGKLAEHGPFKFDEKIDLDSILSFARENVMVMSNTVRGAESKAPLNENILLLINYEAIKDEEGNTHEKYFDINSNTIYKSGKLTVEINASYTDSIEKGAFLKIPFEVVASSVEPINNSVWENNSAFINALMRNLGITSQEEITDSRLKTITKLEISDESLNKIPNGIELLTNLKTLDLTGSRIKNLDNVERVKSLEKLVLDNNGLETIPVGLEKIHPLQHLSLAGNNLHNEVLENVIPSKELILAGNPISNIPNKITGSDILEYLDISNCRFIVVPESIANLNRNISINLTSNQITSLPENILNMVSLDIVKADENIILHPSENQRYIKASEDMNINIKGKFSEEKMIEEIRKKIIISNNDNLFESHKIIYSTLTEQSHIEDYLNDDGSIISEGILTLKATIAGYDLNEKWVPFTLNLTPDESILTKEEVGDNKLTSMQIDAVKKLNESTLDMVTEVVEKPEILSSTVTGYLALTDKNTAITISESEDFKSYTWNFSGDQIEYAVPVDLEIKEKEPTAEQKAKSEDIKVISFSNSGYLPGNTVVEVEFKEKIEEGEYFLYHIDKTQDSGLSYTSMVEIDRNKNKASFTINHTSDYIISKGLIEGILGNPIPKDRPLTVIECMKVAISVAAFLFVFATGMYILSKRSGTSYDVNISDKDLKSLIYLDNKQNGKNKKDVEMKHTGEISAEAKKSIDWVKNEIYTLDVYASSSSSRKSPDESGIIWDYGNSPGTADIDKRDIGDEIKSKFFSD